MALKRKNKSKSHQSFKKEDELLTLLRKRGLGGPLDTPGNPVRFANGGMVKDPIPKQPLYKIPEPIELVKPPRQPLVEFNTAEELEKYINNTPSPLKQRPKINFDTPEELQDYIDRTPSPLKQKPPIDFNSEEDYQNLINQLPSEFDGGVNKQMFKRGGKMKYYDGGYSDVLSRANNRSFNMNKVAVPPGSPATGAQTGISSNGLGMGIGVAAPLATMGLDALMPPDEYGMQKPGVNIAKGAMSGAASGAALGPWGALGGAAIGGTISAIQSKTEKKEFDRQQAELKRARNEYSINQAENRQEIADYDRPSGVMQLRNGGLVSNNSMKVPGNDNLGDVVPLGNKAMVAPGEMIKKDAEGLKILSKENPSKENSFAKRGLMLERNKRGAELSANQLRAVGDRHKVKRGQEGRIKGEYDSRYKDMIAHIDKGVETEFQLQQMTNGNYGENGEENFMHGGLLDVLGLNAAHPYGKIGFKNGGKLKYSGGGGYDPNKDYSALLQEQSTQPTTITQPGFVKGVNNVVGGFGSTMVNTFNRIPDPDSRKNAILKNNEDLADLANRRAYEKLYGTSSEVPATPQEKLTPNANSYAQGPDKNLMNMIDNQRSQTGTYPNWLNDGSQMQPLEPENPYAQGPDAELMKLIDSAQTTPKKSGGKSVAQRPAADPIEMMERGRSLNTVNQPTRQLADPFGMIDPLTAKMKAVPPTPELKAPSGMDSSGTYPGSSASSGNEMALKNVYGQDVLAGAIPALSALRNINAYNKIRPVEKPFLASMVSAPKVDYSGHRAELQRQQRVGDLATRRNYSGSIGAAARAQNIGNYMSASNQLTDSENAMNAQLALRTQGINSMTDNRNAMLLNDFLENKRKREMFKMKGIGDQVTILGNSALGYLNDRQRRALDLQRTKTIMEAYKDSGVNRSFEPMFTDYKR